MKPAKKRLAWFLFVSFGAALALFGFWSHRARLGLPIAALAVLLGLVTWLNAWREFREPDNG